MGTVAAETAAVHHCARRHSHERVFAPVLRRHVASYPARDRRSFRDHELDLSLLPAAARPPRRAARFWRAYQRQQRRAPRRPASDQLVRAVDDAAPAQEAVGHVRRRRATCVARRPRPRSAARVAEPVVAQRVDAGDRDPAPAACPRGRRPADRRARRRGAVADVGRPSRPRISPRGRASGRPRTRGRRRCRMPGRAPGRRAAAPQQAARAAPQRRERGEVAAGAVAADEHARGSTPSCSAPRAERPVERGARVVDRQPGRGARARGGSRR